MSTALAVSGVSKRFGAVEALRGVDLTLAAGEWLALLGPNGAGKTTLVRAIAGRVRPDGGSITLLGAPLTEAGAPGDDARAGLGVVPQEIALYPLMTAEENLRAFGALQGLGGAKLADRVGWALAWTGLADRADDRVGGFSGGMKRRLNIACSVLHRPPVLLLDEPTVGVDPQSRERIWEMLEGLRREGAALLLTTHQLDEAQQVADRIVIIDHGRAIAAGTFDELVRQTIGPQRTVTCRLTSAAPPALFDAGFAALGADAVEVRVNDVATELPERLSELRGAGAQVLDVSIAAPSLRAVFIHLTGRELRE